MQRTPPSGFEPTLPGQAGRLLSEQLLRHRCLGGSCRRFGSNDRALACQRLQALQILRGRVTEQGVCRKAPAAEVFCDAEIRILTNILALKAEHCHLLLALARNPAGSPHTVPKLYTLCLQLHRLETCFPSGLQPLLNSS